MRNNNTMSRQVDIRTAVLADAGSRVALLPGARPQLLSAPSAVPPPQPGFTFHGHLEEVAAVCFAHGSRFLVSGLERARNDQQGPVSPPDGISRYSDASGNVFVWDMRTKRTTVRWKAHAKALLELAAVRVENDSSPTAPRGTPDELLFTYVGSEPPRSALGACLAAIGEELGRSDIFVD
ncbi:MAG: hypothetical protein BJ554DRAFT_2401 [Olpidium bornovanus]|uniref:Uncharacterized protein n=1 Tax=Olpidium bornovanus TaxID=278681 RepID=A0A8H8A2F5_9FUNG|nr:MAG: hypothetical protein BJ554DRAFT_2401 [Olpidium bornovanus]